MKGSEYIKIIKDQGHLPLLKDMEMPRATKNRLRSRQQLRLDKLREELINSTEKLKVKVISAQTISNTDISAYIDELNIDADKILNISNEDGCFFIWYKE